MDELGVTIRDAGAADAAACAAIYAPYVTDSATTFETRAPGPPGDGRADRGGAAAARLAGR